MVLLETPKGNFEYITTPIHRDGIPLFSWEKSIKAKLKTHYHNSNSPLPIVAITDRASSIRKRLNKLSNNSVTVILDWYHLCKKVREFLSMIARNKSERTKHSKWKIYTWKIFRSKRKLRPMLYARNSHWRYSAMEIKSRLDLTEIFCDVDDFSQSERTTLSFYTSINGNPWGKKMQFSDEFERSDDNCHCFSWQWLSNF